MKKIKLANNKGFAIVDDEDFEALDLFSWFLHNNNYACAWVDRKIQRMHRIILNAPPNLQVDHKNGDGLDNRKINLRLATASQNQGNRRKITSKSNIKGVRYKSDGKNRKKRWEARIHFNQKQISIGHFITKEEAGKAYLNMARKLHGEFAYSNIIEKNE